ncbi:serine acetyltransferase [Enterococcus faecium]|uniref:serine acetyltransferase n=1 Tax=Enterococcus faecium TaxID=1352 RepID=UPI00129C4675|nr:serine acetyltransferase [Enterococcus faecium]MCD5103787.1 serine acetyltransferase [Enterococcus faecium]MDK4377301.1 serine acetyltransferase [Enterococcus faecium]NTL97215.1 serine acetyltransferase [Enterococcus faecium]HAQ0365809.1 serine acetyltransferase [Enterococcus faecium]HAR8797401.1 serine acetyltransferase [Enterococcus faecium]
MGLTEIAIIKEHQTLLRKAEYYTNTNNKILKIFYKARLFCLQNKYGLHISLNCCGKGLKIMHLGSILMNGRVTVGENCAFHINTALVAAESSNGAPTLSDGVVGIGAVVLGDVVVGTNVAIGANAVVNKSILEENVAVAGVPAKIVSSNGRTCWNKGARAKEDKNENV